MNVALVEYNLTSITQFAKHTPEGELNPKMATSTSRSFSTGYGSRSNSTNGKGVRRELDDPPFSRLFVLGSKETTKEQFVDAFEKFGTIQDVTVLKDKQKNENKGIEM